MKVLVCGDRNWTNWKFLYQCLDVFHKQTPITVLIEGEAKGADSFARNWAISRGIKIDPYPAEWHKYRHAAGPIRNTKMLVQGKPEYGIAFHNDIANSKGTKDMVERLNAAHIPVIVLKEEMVDKKTLRGIKKVDMEQ